MTSEELQKRMTELKINQIEMAKLVGVTAKSVNFWLRKGRDPHPAIDAYFRIFDKLSPPEQALEIQENAR